MGFGETYTRGFTVVVPAMVAGVTDPNDWIKHFNIRIMARSHHNQYFFQPIWLCSCDPGFSIGITRPMKKYSTMKRYPAAFRWSIWQASTWEEWVLTHCGLVTPYGDRSWSTLAQVMVCCLTAPSQAITWTNVDLSVRSSDIHLRAISWDISQPSITKPCLKIIWSKNSFKTPRGQWVNTSRHEQMATSLKPASSNIFSWKRIGMF